MSWLMLSGYVAVIDLLNLIWYSNTSDPSVAIVAVDGFVLGAIVGVLAFVLFNRGYLWRR